MTETAGTARQDFAALAEKIDGFMRVMDERDRRYELHFRKIEESATTAQSSATTAIEKAEMIAREQRDSQNEWRAAMKDREMQFARHQDVDALRIDVKSLGDTRSEATGRATQQTATHSTNQWAIGLGLSLAGGVAGLAWAVVSHFLR